MLICWRMLAGKSAHWLINANAAAALIVLAVVSVVDLGAVVAGWNVRHAREVGSRGVALDLGYLHTLGAPALVSLAELETTLDDAVLRDRVAAVRQDILLNVRRRQSEWRGWTWRDQRRLDRIDALQRNGALAPPSPGAHDWDGRLIRTAPPSAPAPVASPPSVPISAAAVSRGVYSGSTAGASRSPLLRSETERVVCCSSASTSPRSLSLAAASSVRSSVSIDCSSLMLISTSTEYVAI